MGKKTVIFSLLAILYFIPMNLYSQDKIEWKNKNEINHVANVDTFQLKVDLYAHYITFIDDVDYYLKRTRVGNTSYFFRFVPIGSGRLRWVIEIYKLENNLGSLVAEGMVDRWTDFLMANFDLNRNSFVFNTLNAEWDQNGDMISLTKEDEIGEISISDIW
jgi:hypothetical protein